MAFRRKIEISISNNTGINVNITDLKMDFEIIKTLSSTPSQAKINVFNLSSDTIRSIATIGGNILIKAGYEDEGILNIFYGNITRVTSKKDGVNRITAIEAIDSHNVLTDSIDSISYGSNTQIITVIRYLINILALPIGNDISDITGVLQQGYADHGKVKDILDRLLASINRKWAVVNGQVLIYLSNASPVNNYRVSINKDSGLIGIPELLMDSTNSVSVTSGSTIIAKRYKVKCFLYPQIVPGSKISLQSGIDTNKVEYVNGDFVVESAIYNGDNWDGDFIIMMEVKGV